MVGPIVFGIVGAGGSHFATKSAEEAKSRKKLDLIKDLADLSEEQREAVEAAKGQSVEELETRETLGIGLLQDLPPNASDRAREIRARLREKMQAKIKNLTPAQRKQVGKMVGRLTSEERIRINQAEDREKAVKEIVEEKVERVMQGEVPEAVGRSVALRPEQAAGATFAP